MTDWRKRYRFTIEFEADRDMVPGWGHQVEDWVELATYQFKKQSHYNTAFRVVSTDEFPRDAKGSA